MCFPSLSKRECEIVRLLADYDLNMAEVGRATHYHINTIDYHVKKIEEKTGLSPKKFYDMTVLLVMVKKQEESNEQNQLRKAPGGV